MLNFNFKNTQMKKNLLSLLAFIAFSLSSMAQTLISASPSSGTPGTVVTLVYTLPCDACSPNDYFFINGGRLNPGSYFDLGFGDGFYIYLSDRIGFDGTNYIWRSYVKITGVTTGPILIGYTDNDTGVNSGFTSSTNFIVTIPPTVNSFSPAAGVAGNTTVITGTNFIGTTGVSFNGVAATSFTVDSSTQITATVPTSTTGTIAVSNDYGTGYSATNYVYIPNTQIQAAFNATTVATMTTPINVDAVSGAEAYTYKVVNGGFTYEKERTGTNMGYFNFSQIPGTTFGTTYTVTVKAKISGAYGNYGSSVTITTPAVTALTKLNPANCGATLTSLGQRIYATPVTGATGYRFEVTSNVNTTTYDTANYYFTLANVGGGQYGQSYSVRVATLLNGTYGSFGDACTVTAPIPTTKVRSTQCGITLASLSTTIASDIVTDATNYMFEIIGGGLSREYESTTYTLKFNRVPGYASLNTTYAIRVKVKVNGTYGVYGTSCNVTTPATRDGEFDEEFTDFTVVSYPNPFAGTFQLDLKSTSNSEINVMVYDMLGKQIENRSFNALEVYNQEFGANYAAGIYNVMVSQNGTTKTVRVIKN